MLPGSKQEHAPNSSLPVASPQVRQLSSTLKRGRKLCRTTGRRDVLESEKSCSPMEMFPKFQTPTSFAPNLQDNRITKSVKGSLTFLFRSRPSRMDAPAKGQPPCTVCTQGRNAKPSGVVRSSTGRELVLSKEGDHKYLIFTTSIYPQYSSSTRS